MQIFMPSYRNVTHYLIYKTESNQCTLIHYNYSSNTLVCLDLRNVFMDYTSKPLYAPPYLLGIGQVTFPTALSFSPGMYNTLISAHSTPVTTLKLPTHCSFNVHTNFIARHYIIHDF